MTTIEALAECIESNNKLRGELNESEAANAVMREALTTIISYEVIGTRIYNLGHNALSTTAGKSLLEERDRLRSAFTESQKEYSEALRNGLSHEDAHQLSIAIIQKSL
jgi:hypothetical protein